MEILLEIAFFVLEFFGDLLINMLFQGAFEVGEHKVKNARKKRFANRVAQAREKGMPVPEERPPYGDLASIVIYTAMGLITGAISLVVVPHSFIHNITGRLVYLFVGPVLAGLCMSLIGKARDRRGDELVRMDKFVYGFLFAFAMTGVRFAFAI